MNLVESILVQLRGGTSDERGEALRRAYAMRDLNDAVKTYRRAHVCFKMERTDDRMAAWSATATQLQVVREDVRRYLSNDEVKQVFNAH